MSFLEADVALPRQQFHIDIDICAEQGHVLAIVGPNGAGKSTLVQALSGLLALESGKVVVGGTVWEDPASRLRLAPQRRSIGVMFQDLALFGKMTALENVAYGLRSTPMKKSDAMVAARRTLQRLDADDLADVRAGELSGGQAQKVALARAFAAKPDLLLLDEPTSKLDVTDQRETRQTLSTALFDYPGTALLVTHQPMEALALAQQIVVVEEGRVTQRGASNELQLQPRTPYVAEFVGVNLLEGRGSVDHVRLTGGASVAVVGAPSGDVLVAIHPTAVALHRTPPEGTPRNVWRLDVAEVNLEGERVRVRLTGEVTLVAEITRSAAAQLQIEAKGPVWASTKATQVRTYPR
ncbi:MAG: molybdate transport system ATP-binding protein [Actinomycetota bacterium]|jgi:molybdate transport system ATP-binding protein|nr:molybdate transport system ATP-binding protein [Actinomycetota bacterium]